MKTFVGIFTVLCMAVYMADARAMGLRGDRSGERSDDAHGNALQACRIENANGDLLGNATQCRGNITCGANGSGLDIQINGTTYKVFYCDYPYPTPKMACSVEGVETRRICPDNLLCNNGPYQGTNPRSGATFEYFICGNETDNKPEYAKALTQHACSVDGSVLRNCSADSPCDGAKLSVASSELTFCRGPNNEENFDYLSVFGGHRENDSAEENSVESVESQESAESPESAESSNSASNSISEERGDRRRFIGRQLGQRRRNKSGSSSK